MYYLLLVHSALRWLVLLALCVAIVVAWDGYRTKRSFRLSDRIVVSAGSILTHIQLIVGLLLYYWSPVVQGFWDQHTGGWSEQAFFALVHFGLMSVAVILITVGSALAKQTDDSDALRFKSVLIYYLIGLIVILISIPWPFSPLAQRPLLRSF